MLRKPSPNETPSFIEAYHTDYNQHLLNQTGEQATTKRAARHAIENGDSLALDEVKDRLLKGRNNNFSVSVYTDIVKDMVESDNPIRELLDDTKQELLDNNNNGTTVKTFMMLAKQLVDTKNTARRNRDEVNHTTEPV